jgi:SAM-dependent methyltransferase
MRIPNTLSKFLRLIDGTQKDPETKHIAELQFWKSTLKQYIEWYRGDLPTLYNEKSPRKKDKVKAATEKDSAILTWEKVHQQPKYIEDLQVKPNTFGKGKLLDIGAGPHPSGRVFNKMEIYSLDPLIPQYAQAGFPLHYYDSVKYVVAHAEEIPVPDNFFDAIISVNALDHVDDFEKTVQEIRRVAKKSAKLRFHLHYHAATTEEPIELTDERIRKAFSWAKNFHKVAESREKRGTTLKTKGEKYVVWSNF